MMFYNDDVEIYNKEPDVFEDMDYSGFVEGVKYNDDYDYEELYHA